MQRLLFLLAIGLLMTSPVLAQVALIPVDIDIKPGSDPNSVNCYNLSEVITVAIFSTADFDATTIDPAAVSFEEASEIHVSPKTGQPRLLLEDVDGDGLMDLVFHFHLGETSLDCDSADGTLSGRASPSNSRAMKRRRSSTI